MKKYIILSAILFVMGAGCRSTSTIAPLVASGSLLGRVGLFDAHGNPITDKSGVRVEAEGTTISVVSDTGGNWLLTTLPAGKYAITFSKAGFGTVRNTSFTYVASDTATYGSRVDLYQPVSFSIFIDSVSATADTTHPYDRFGYLRGHIEGADLADSAIIKAYVYFSKSPTIDFFDTTTFLGGLLWDNSRFIPLTKRGANLTFETNNWEVCGPQGWVKSGLHIYVQAFGLTSKYSPRYYDSLTGKWVLPNPPPSSTVRSIVIP